MFETALLSQRPARRRTPLLATAVGAHILLLGGVVVGQYWKVDAVAEPQNALVNQILHVQLPVPPPPAEAPRRQQSAPPQKHDVVPPTPVKDSPPAPRQPTTVPDVIPPTPAEPQTAPESPGVPNSTGNDRTVGNGVDFSIGDDNGPIEIGKGITPPVAITRVSPLYTESARRARVQGVVVVETIIDRDGNVGNVKVLRGLGFGLDQNAAEAVARWKFQPARGADGRPVSVYFRLTVDYHLN